MDKRLLVVGLVIYGIVLMAAIIDQNHDKKFNRSLRHRHDPKTVIMKKKSPKPPADFYANMSFNADVIVVGKQVVKKAKPDKIKLIDPEVCVLKLLQQFPWCPRYLSSTSETITMAYAGVALDESNIPKNYGKQFRQILYDLASVKVVHNDLKPQNFLVLDGRLMLIDFGYSHINKQVPCEPDNTDHSQLMKRGMTIRMMFKCMQAIATNKAGKMSKKAFVDNNGVRKDISMIQYLKYRFVCNL